MTYLSPKNHYSLDGLKIEITGDKRVTSSITTLQVWQAIKVFPHLQSRLDTRLISFETYDLGTYALLTDRHAHMPFQSWRMRPKAVDHVVFTLNTQSFEMTLEVRVSGEAEALISGRNTFLYLKTKK